jgi:hypothetical protein
MESADKGIDAESFHILKHDIKNQLSNIILLLDQLKYEMRNDDPELLQYVEMIASSTIRIDVLLKGTD